MSDLAQIGLTAEQQAARANAVGASEVHDALFNPAELWLRKTGREPRREDDALSRLGNMIEPYILGEYQRQTGAVVRAKPDTLRRGRMVAHLDAIADTGDVSEVAVECKWRGHREGWGEPRSADIPAPVMLQVQSQMLLAGLRFAHVPVLFMRPPIVLYAIDFDAELAAMIEAGVERFWWHVEHDTPPEVDADRPEALAVIRRIYPGTDGRKVSAPRDLEHWRTVCVQAAEEAKRYEAAADAAKAHLLKFMGSAAELEFSDGTLLRRKLVKRKGYSVEPAEYIDARFTRPRSTEHE